MGKQTICICENKNADQLRSNREADHAFVFATPIVHFLHFLNPKFQATSHLLDCTGRFVSDLFRTTLVFSWCGSNAIAIECYSPVQIIEERDQIES